MRFIHLVLLAGAIWVGYTLWEKNKESTEAEMAGPEYSENGFAQLPGLQDQDADTVYVIAPQDCPKEASQRALRLAEDLQEQGIPVVKTSNVNYSFSATPSQDVLDRMNGVMRGEVPIVIINGRGKANPSMAEVVAEYQEGSGS